MKPVFMALLFSSFVNCVLVVTVFVLFENAVLWEEAARQTFLHLQASTKSYTYRVIK